MSATIFRHEFRIRLRSVITWSLSVAAIILFFFVFFEAFAGQAELLNQMMDRFPPQMRAAFNLDQMDLSTVLGFYSFLLMFVQLILAVQASTYGVELVSVEETDLTADFLLSKPVSRVQVLTSKLLAVLVSLLITNLVLWVSTFIAITAFRGERAYDLPTLILLLASVLLFQFFFVGVGLIISLLVKRVRNVTPYALGLAFGTYVLSAFTGVFGDIKLELLTPFKHFDAAYIVQQSAFDTPLVLLNVAVTLLAVGLSYWFFTRRDIPAVS